jgi:hypothetical protein
MFADFAGLKLRIPEGWCDISADLPPGSPPTLARGTGVGALQFSVAKWHGGVNPVVAEGDLREMFLRFCQAHSFHDMEPSIPEGCGVPCIGGVSATPQEVVAVWFLSNGTDVALVTYTRPHANDPATAEELRQATDMVGSITFPH